MFHGNNPAPFSKGPGFHQLNCATHVRSHSLTCSMTAHVMVELLPAFHTNLHQLLCLSLLPIKTSNLSFTPR